MGAAIGVEAAIENVAVVLGPGINIKRSPLCGRNFEYFSEDPILSGILGAASVRGIQSKGVGTSLKHFAANNQEFDRMRASSDVDPRPLREIYLRGFERVVKDAAPWTVMCSYNKLNGVWTSEDPWLLTSVLCDDWGFDGLVVSDWGAVNDRVVGVAAGLDWRCRPRVDGPMRSWSRPCAREPFPKACSTPLPLVPSTSCAKRGSVRPSQVRSTSTRTTRSRGKPLVARSCC